MELDKTKFHKEVIGPFTGQKFTIRRVRFKDFMVTLGTLPVSTANAVQDVLAALKEKADSGDKEAEEKVTRFYASKGIVEPKVWFGDEKECPEDQIYFADLGGDLDYVVGEVVGYSHEMAGLKDFESFFRRARAEIAGPDGEEVRAEAVEPPPDGPIQ